MSPSLSLTLPVSAPADHGITQAELLSTTRLRLSESIRSSTKQAGRVIMRTASGRRRLVLTPAQAAILEELFALPRTVPEALARLLAKRDDSPTVALDCPPLGEYYELILQAHAAGVLVTNGEGHGPTLAHEWPLRLTPLIAQLLGGAMVLAGAFSLALLPWAGPTTLTDLLGGWLLACVLMSLGQMMAASALAGGGCVVRDPQLHWRTLLPHFRIDTAEAVSGGRQCEAAVAVMRIAPLFAGAALVAWLAPSWLVLVLTALLFVLAPVPGSAAWQWLGARHGEPRFSVRSGTLFDPRRADAWVRWNAWIADTKVDFGVTAIAWFFVWSVLCVIVCAACVPGLAQEFAAGFGAGGLPSLGLSIVAFALALVVFGAALIGALMRHNALKSEAARLQRPGSVAHVALSTDVASALRQVPLFEQLSAVDLNALAKAVTPIGITAGQVVFYEDDPVDAFYIVLEGELEILKLRPAPGIGSDTIGRLGAGDSFGEIALLEDTTRTATVRAVQACRLLRLASSDFGRLVVDTVGVGRIRERLQNTAFLSRLVFFAGWPSDALMRFSRHCHHVRYEAGEHVMKKGRHNANFFLIYDGTFEAGANGQKLRRMRPGDYFGEISLLENGIATADVVAVEESRCLVLERADFLEFFAQDYRIGLRMEALAAQRLGTEVFASR